MIQIERATLRVVRLPLKEPFTTAFGTVDERRVVIVALEADGLVGYGEASPLEAPLYTAETVETVWYALDTFFLPAVVGPRLEGLDDVPRWLARYRGHPMARAAVEAAAADLLARARGVPLARLLGGVRDEIPVGVSIGLQPSVEALLDQVALYRAQGYRRIKIKIRPGEDVGPARAVRRAYEDLPLTVDANAAYGLTDAAVFEALDDLGLLMIEQPLGPGDLVDHAALQRRLRTPLCLDESVRAPDDARTAIALGACKIINVKPGRVGGLTAARAIHDIAAAGSIGLWCGGLFESGIGRAANVAVATWPHFAYPHDISASDRYVHEDLVEPPITMTPHGTIRVPDRPGLGWEPVLERLVAFTERTAVVLPSDS